jgi:hypothetical protein
MQSLTFQIFNMNYEDRAHAAWMQHNTAQEATVAPKTRQQVVTELWHLSRTGLSGMTQPPGRHDRLTWVKDNMRLHYPELCRVRLEDRDMTPKELWNEINEILN